MNKDFEYETECINNETVIELSLTCNTTHLMK